MHFWAIFVPSRGELLCLYIYLLFVRLLVAGTLPRFYSLLYFQDPVEHSRAQQIFVDVIKTFLKIRIIWVTRRGVGVLGGRERGWLPQGLSDFSGVFQSPGEL